MNRLRITWLVVLLGAAAFGQSEPPVKASEKSEPASTPASPASAPVSVPVPVVRVPSTPSPASIPAADGNAEARREPGPVGPGLESQLGWSSEQVGLREPTVTTVRTNRGPELRGVLPRAARSERRGFGGFLSGFAGLFNPFAPVSTGTEARNEHWYDGGVQSAPLPRGMRDERWHEPKTDLFSIGLERGAKPEESTRKRGKREAPVDGVK